MSASSDGYCSDPDDTHITLTTSNIFTSYLDWERQTHSTLLIRNLYGFIKRNADGSLVEAEAPAPEEWEDVVDVLMNWRRRKGRATAVILRYCYPVVPEDKKGHPALLWEYIKSLYTDELSRAAPNILDRYHDPPPPQTSVPEDINRLDAIYYQLSVLPKYAIAEKDHARRLARATRFREEYDRVHFWYIHNSGLEPEKTSREGIDEIRRMVRDIEWGLRTIPRAAAGVTGERGEGGGARGSAGGRRGRGRGRGGGGAGGQWICSTCRQRGHTKEDCPNAERVEAFFASLSLS